MNRIKQLREERGMTQPELGKVLNVQGAAMSKYENEKVPLTTDTIKSLAAFFGVSTDYLLGKTDEKDDKEQSEPEYTTQKERQLLELYRNYEDNGYSETLMEGIKCFFPELAETKSHLSQSEEKIMVTFRNLNEDNQDIIIGKAKELLREQLYADPVAAGELRKASGK